MHGIEVPHFACLAVSVSPEPSVLVTRLASRVALAGRADARDVHTSNISYIIVYILCIYCIKLVVYVVYLQFIIHYST